MVIREDLVQSAVTFLQDPSVATSPLEKRIAFLQSKNLTQEEIDASLARAGDSTIPQSAGGYAYQSQVARQPIPPQYGYGQYPPGYWPQSPPPEVPRRDWRDYFIMATVMSGLGYGVYVLAKRYVVPLIAPPTPPQLEQDKASIDESFSRAFALIEQLTTDTAAIKSSEDARKEKLDAALAEMESVVEEMKTASRRRDDDSRRINEEVRSLQALIPRAMKTQEENTDNRLKELNVELKGLKTLISNRMSGQGVPQAGVPRGPASAGSGQNIYTSSANTQGAASANTNGVNEAATSATSPSTEATSASNSVPDRSNNASPFNRYSSKGGIPAWQMAAAKKAEEKKAEVGNAGDDSVNAASSIVS